MIKKIQTDKAPQAIGPYSQAVEANGFLFVSGQIPLRSDGSLVEGDVVAEAKQVLANIEAILQAADLSRDAVVRCTIFLTNMSDFSAVNEVYGDFFGNHKPARATVAVAALPKGVNVEIDCIAALS